LKKIRSLDKKEVNVVKNRDFHHQNWKKLNFSHICRGLIPRWYPLFETLKWYRFLGFLWFFVKSWVKLDLWTKNRSKCSKIVIFTTKIVKHMFWVYLIVQRSNFLQRLAKNQRNPRNLYHSRVSKSGYHLGIKPYKYAKNWVFSKFGGKITILTFLTWF